MVKKKVEEKKEPPVLIIYKEEAESKLKKRLEEGTEIRNTSVNNEHDLEALNQQFKNWSEFNIELLSRIFNNDEIKNEYKYAHGSSRIVPNANALWGSNRFPALYENFINHINAKLNKLGSLINRLELIPESVPSEISETEALEKREFDKKNIKNIFIVHGHDELNLLKLKEQLRNKWNLEPVVLSSKPGKGRTLIEKFEEEAKKASYAIALFTPDDIVLVKNDEYSQSRPNVIFELGWFYGRLGRQNVCILFKEGTRIHSDLNGISRIQFKETILEVINEIEAELIEAKILG